MMAALVEPGYVCGNKVPTVCFPNDPDEDRLFVWLAVVNSLTFDWMLRRVLTTSINYFVLLSIPMPSIKPNGLPWRRLATAARELHELNLAARTLKPTVRPQDCAQGLMSKWPVPIASPLQNLI